MLNHSSKIAIVGAGLCGSFLAYLLAKNNFSNLSLYEKRTLDDSKMLGKVCGGCLHHRAVDILDSYELSRVIVPGTEIKRISLVSAEHKVSFPLRHGKWVSRRLLDKGLRDAAIETGVPLYHSQVKILDSARGLLSVDGREVNFELIIYCGGIGGTGLCSWEEETRAGRGFGFQGILELKHAHSEALQDIQPGEVRFLIDDEGYHGVVKVEGASPFLHVASYLRGKNLKTSDFLNKHLSLENLQERSATPPLQRKRVASQGRVFLCGDALGYPEPFSGEGMLYACESAVKFMKTLSHHAVSDMALFQLSASWAAYVEATQKWQWQRCAWTTWGITTALKRRLLLPLAPYFAPVITRRW